MKIRLISLFYTAIFTALTLTSFRTWAQSPVGTGISYQAQLLDGGAPANGSYQFELSLWTAESGGDQVGTTVVTAADVTYGLVELEADFGPGAFNGEERWLRIGVAPDSRRNDSMRSGAASRGTFTLLSPRRRIQPAPVAQFALNSAPGNSLDAADGDPADALYVDSSGAVGIGTTNPAALLHVEGGGDLGNLLGLLDTELDDAQGGAVNGLEQVWSIKVAGNLAYVTSQADDSMTIFDIADPRDISFIGAIADDNQGGTAQFLNNAQGLDVARSVAYVCSLTEDTVTAIDVSNPAAPVELGFIRDDNQGGIATGLNGSLALFASGTLVYVVSATDDALSIIDFSEPGRPRETDAIFHGSLVGGSTVTGLDNPRDVWVTAGVAIVSASNSDAVSFFDVSDPANITQLGVITDNNQGGTAQGLDSPERLFVDGYLVYVTSSADDALSIIDFSDPTAPVELGFIADSESGGTAESLEGARAVWVEGNRAYVVASSDFALTVIDVSDPANPFEIASVVDDLFGGDIAELGAPIDVAVSRNVALVVTNVDDSLLTFNATVPKPALIIRGDAFKDTGPMWSVFSDRRLKSEVQPLHGSLDRILQLQPVSFEYNSAWEEAFQSPPPTGPQTGFIAQEYGEVFPHQVEIDPQSGYLAIDPSNTLPELVGALQSVHQKLSENEAELKATREEIAELKARLEAQDN